MKNRRVSKLPFKVLDAPNITDDFYLNLLDWSAKNVLAVALYNAVYIWSAETQRCQKLCQVEHDDSITSVGWSQSGSHLAVGTHRGIIMIYDTTGQGPVRKIGGHNSRVSAVAWNQQIISTGSRDRTIMNNDLRAPQKINRLVGHKQEVCGLKWSFDNSQLASGGNDNKLFIWSLNSN